jgi:hypothetical protein
MFYRNPWIEWYLYVTNSTARAMFQQRESIYMVDWGSRLRWRLK